MALDAIIEGSEVKSAPIGIVSIDEDNHDWIVEQCEQEKLTLLMKISDYYEDAVFPVEELEQFIVEIKILKKLPSCSDEMQKLLTETIQLAKLGIDRSLPMLFLAD